MTLASLGDELYKWNAFLAFCNYSILLIIVLWPWFMQVEACPVGFGRLYCMSHHSIIDNSVRFMDSQCPC